MAEKRTRQQQNSRSENAKRPRLGLGSALEDGGDEADVHGHEAPEINEDRYSSDTNSSTSNEFSDSGREQTDAYRLRLDDTADDGSATEANSQDEPKKRGLPALTSPETKSPRQRRAERRIAEQPDGDFTDEEEGPVAITGMQALTGSELLLDRKAEGDDNGGSVGSTRVAPPGWYRSPGRTRPRPRPRLLNDNSASPMATGLQALLGSSSPYFAPSPSPSSSSASASSSSSSEGSTPYSLDETVNPEESDLVNDLHPGERSTRDRPNDEAAWLVYRRGGMVDYFLTRYLSNIARTLNFMVRARAAGIDVSSFDSLAAVSPDRWGDLVESPDDAAEIVVESLLNLPLSNINLLAEQAAKLRSELRELGVTIE